MGRVTVEELVEELVRHDPAIPNGGQGECDLLSLVPLPESVRVLREGTDPEPGQFIEIAGAARARLDTVPEDLIGRRRQHLAPDLFNTGDVGARGEGHEHESGSERPPKALENPGEGPAVAVPAVAVPARGERSL